MALVPIILATVISTIPILSLIPAVPLIALIPVLSVIATIPLIFVPSFTPIVRSSKQICIGLSTLSSSDPHNLVSFHLVSAC